MNLLLKFVGELNQIYSKSTSLSPTLLLINPIFVALGWHRSLFYPYSNIQLRGEGISVVPDDE